MLVNPRFGMLLFRKRNFGGEDCSQQNSALRRRHDQPLGEGRDGEVQFFALSVFRVHPFFCCVGKAQGAVVNTHRVRRRQTSRLPRRTFEVSEYRPDALRERNFALTHPLRFVFPTSSGFAKMLAHSGLLLWYYYYYVRCQFDGTSRSAKSLA